MIKAKEFMSLPYGTRKRISDFIQEYIDIDPEKGFMQNGEIVEKAYQQSFKLLVTEEIFTVKELRKTLFTDYHVLLPIEWFGGIQK